jgi:hypothetical protein
MDNEQVPTGVLWNLGVDLVELAQPIQGLSLITTYLRLRPLSSGLRGGVMKSGKKPASIVGQMSNSACCKWDDHS